MVPGAPFGAEMVDRALDGRGVPGEAGSTRPWTLKAGVVELRPLVEGGVRIATEVLIPLAETAALARECLAECARLAIETDTLLFDPQLLRQVTERDADALAEQFMRTARYAGEMMGVPEALPAAFGIPRTGMRAGTKVFLGIVGFFVVLYLAADFLIGRLR